MAAPYAKTEQALTTVTPRMLARLDAYAEATERSRADAIRGFIDEGLARWEAENPNTERENDTPVI